MCLIKCIVCKIYDLIIDRLRSCFADTLSHSAGNILRRVTVNEYLAFLFNDLHLLFGDGSADVIRLSHGITAKGSEYLNNLLLIHDASVSNLQNRFQKRCLIGNFAMVKLIGNKLGNRFHRTGTIQCHDSCHVFDGSRMHIHTNSGNTGRFQLENALRLTFRQHGKGFRVIVRYFINVKVRLQFTNLSFGIFNDRQVS